ncbi:MAG: DUF721 domain-containing protein [Xenococcaceae cyanobacterium]
MFFHSLAEILATIPEQPGWENYKQYCQLLEAWQAIVTPEIARQTRPLYVKRQVLWVATANSVWAQELSLKRYTFLQQLNRRLAFSLKDIRFTSYRQQQNSDRLSASIDNPDLKSHHPSSINVKYSPIPSDSLPLVDEPQAVVKNWIDVLQARSSQFSVCPQCQSPTPKGELKRWNLCCHCAAKTWSDK